MARQHEFLHAPSGRRETARSRSARSGAAISTRSLRAEGDALQGSVQNIVYIISTRSLRAEGDSKNAQSLIRALLRLYKDNRNRPLI